MQTIIRNAALPFRAWIVEGEPFFFTTRQQARDFKRDESIAGKVLKVLVITDNG